MTVFVGSLALALACAGGEPAEEPAGVSAAPVPAPTEPAAPLSCPTGAAVRSGTLPAEVAGRVDLLPPHFAEWPDGGTPAEKALHTLPDPSAADVDPGDRAVHWWCEREGAVDGPFAVVYYGELYATGAFTDGQPDGDWVLGVFDGDPAWSKGRYARGKRVGAWSYADESGATVFEQGDFADDAPTGTWTLAFDPPRKVKH